MPKITEYKRRHNKEYFRKKREYYKRFVARYKTRFGCKRCGYKEYDIALDLHHRNPNEKDKTVGKFMNGSHSFKKLKSEIRKCDILCAICHRLEHAK